ncbi:MAG: hypothetical protein CBB71_11965 [Rhodopirellula sp. TMED11]|nr:MAG: hypothetical protein CBB71_11965 [Rhodopirellula sp. TMED11]
MLQLTSACLPRQSFWSRLALAVLAFGLRVPLQATEPAATEPTLRKPNVLFIISDDLSMTLSGMGHPECKTPNLDAFAKTGVSFTSAYCQFPLCGPSRASLMTGQYPMINGVKGNGGTVAVNRVTLPKHFANHGYWTGRVSKIYHMGIPGDIVEGKPGNDHAASWHEAHNMMAMEAITPGKATDFLNPESVTQYAAERKKWLAARAANEPYQHTQVARAQYASIEVAEKDQGLLADTMATDQAIELLQQRANDQRPFFLAVGLIRPHFPFIGTTETMGQYHADELAIPNVPANDHQDMPKQTINTVLKFEKPAQQEMRRAYFGAVSFMDRQVGRLLEAMETLQLRDNTIVVFVSDHGYLLGEHHMWKKAKLWEEAIHVPMIISAPGKTQGATCQRTVELVDLYPTLTELAGLPSDSAAQGNSLAALLENPEATHAKQNALIQVNGGFGLRHGRWAYMWYPKSKKHPEGVMLYDMQQDATQYQNLAELKEHQEVRQRMHQQLMQRIEAAQGK